MPLRRYTPIVRPAYTVIGENTSPDRLWVFLHGILGDRTNWRGVAQRTIDGRPGEAALLIDQRGHGESQGFGPPHTVRAAALDVLGLLEWLEADLGRPRLSVVGHSFGGKVALAIAQLDPAHLDAAWIIDANPGAQPGDRGEASPERLVSILTDLPSRFDNRRAFSEALSGAGVGAGVAAWLGKSLRRTATGALLLVLDLLAVEALIDDYYAQDLWHVLESPPPGVHIHLVVGERSDALSEADRRRATAAQGPQLSVHTIEDAGHWVHVDAPDRLLSHLRGRMVSLASSGT